MADLDMEHYDSEDEDNIVSRALGGSSGTGARAGGGGGQRVAVAAPATVAAVLQGFGSADSPGS